MRTTLIRSSKNSMINWIKDIVVNINNKDCRYSILAMMQNHDKCQIWFTSLMGFFYQYGINCYDANRSAELELYLQIIDYILSNSYMAKF